MVGQEELRNKKRVMQEMIAEELKKKTKTDLNFFDRWDMQVHFTKKIVSLEPYPAALDGKHYQLAEMFYI